MVPLPIDPVLPDVVRAVRDERVLVLEAPPGAGKTTRVPAALMDAGLGDVVVLEPRRMAARMAADRVAKERGEAVGGPVGYQVRFEDRTSAATRLTFVTEGILTRRLLSDPTLARIGVVVLDEFHERHLHGDVALAWLRRLRTAARPDIRIVVMSATLDAGPVATFLGARTIRSEGRMYEVDVSYEDGPDDRKLELRVASAVRGLARAEPSGDILVFLPGRAEIRRATDSCAGIAQEHGRLLLPLHGELDVAEQDRAVLPQRQPKIVLATNVAESSVTIDGVTGVIDSGLVRVPGHDPWSGLPLLRTLKTSRASAIQRAGRAGRTRPGRAIRLYSRGDHDQRPEHDVPEIQRSDLTETALSLARLDAAQELSWLDAPPAGAWDQARSLLRSLGAVGADGAILALGERLLRLPLHPRLGRVVLEGAARGLRREACILAALLGERDPRVRGDRPGPRENAGATERSDALLLLDLYEEAEAAGFSPHAIRAIGLDADVARSVRRAVKQIADAVEDRVGVEDRRQGPRGTDDALLYALLTGFPDRVARRVTPGSRTFAAAGGGQLELAQESAVRDAPWICAVSAGADDRVRGASVSRIRIASAIEPEWLIDACPADVEERTKVTWDDRTEAVVARSQIVYRGLVLHDGPEGGASPEAAELLFARAKAAGPRRFAPEGVLDRWISRMRFVHASDPSIPAPSDDDVLDALRELCAERTSFVDLENAGLTQRLAGRFRTDADLDRLAPERVTLPNGRELPVHYEATAAPWIESYLQDFCGVKESPRVGRAPLVLHLLAPNRRAVQVTTDLPGFWVRHYPAIRRELMRRYPRHAWPEDPSVVVPMKVRRGPR